MAEIVLQGVSKWYGQYQAVRDLDLQVKDKEFLILLGPSGCGKTTTLRSIAGLESVDAGEIRIDGKRVNEIRAGERDMAFVFQLYALYPHLTVFENIAFPLRAKKIPRAEIETRVQEAARIVRLRDVLDKKPEALSSGSRQKVALARALVRRPKAFLMDEPLGSLDAKFREKVRVELKRLHLGLGATTVYVTHDQLEAMTLGDRIAVMKDGVLQQVGTPREVYDRPANAFVAAFIGSPGMNLNPGSLRREGGNLKVLLGGQYWEVPEDRLSHTLEGTLPPGNGVVLGIRPEHLLPSAPGKGILSGKVEVVEPHGSFNLLSVDCRASAFRIKVHASMTPSRGSVFHFQPAAEHACLFHPGTGETLGSDRD